MQHGKARKQAVGKLCQCTYFYVVLEGELLLPRSGDAVTEGAPGFEPTNRICCRCFPPMLPRCFQPPLPLYPDNECFCPRFYSKDVSVGVPDTWRRGAHSSVSGLLDARFEEAITRREPCISPTSPISVRIVHYWNPSGALAWDISMPMHAREMAPVELIPATELLAENIQCTQQPLV